MPYGCGVLFSTTFPVGTNVFAGTTTAQRCELFRCGGYDDGYGWRASLQLCLDTYASGISNVLLSNLNISNSISDGLSIIGGIGRLSNAIAAQVNIPNYGVGASGRHGAWASSETFGGLTFSNSTVVENRDDSPNFAFNFVTNGAPYAQSIQGINVGNATVTLTYATVPGFPYRLERATNVSSPTWLTISGSVTYATGSSVTFIDPNPPLDGQRYYRTVSP
jgi:hypothetical protein